MTTLTLSEEQKQKIEQSILDLKQQMIDVCSKAPEESGFSLQKSHGGVKIYQKKHESSSVNIFHARCRFVGTSDANALLKNTYVKNQQDEAFRKKSDPDCVKFTVLNQDGERLTFASVYTMGSRLISDRDFVSVSEAFYSLEMPGAGEVKKAAMVVQVPVPDSSKLVPSAKGLVRGHTTTSFLFVEDQAVNAIDVFLLLHPEPSGMIPGFLINSLADRGAVAPIQTWAREYNLTIV